MDHSSSREPYQHIAPSYHASDSAPLFGTAEHHHHHHYHHLQQQKRRKKILFASLALFLAALTVAVMAAAVVAAVVIAVSAARERRPRSALLIIKNSRIWTASAVPDGSTSTSSRLPSALAVTHDGRIALVADTETVEARFYTDRNEGGLTIDHGTYLSPPLVVPGFIDSHVHILQGGMNMITCELGPARGKDDFRTIVSGYMEKEGLEPDMWLLGGDWDHERFPGSVLPDKSWIDDLTPNNPAYLRRMDGHMALANSLALKLANITRDTADPDGGTIVRGPDGEPTGIVKENAMELIRKMIPPAPEEDEDKAIELAQDYALSTGVTSVYNMGSAREYGILKRNHDAGKLRIRVHHAQQLGEWEQLKQIIDRDGRGTDLLSVGGLKAFMDGSLGSHTALMFEPYTDAQNDTGIQVTSDEDLLHWSLEADKLGFQVCTHAIGDRGVSKVLDLYDNVTAINGPKDRRFRIEHSQQIRQQDRIRYKQGGYIASMQPLHLVDDIVWAEKLIGPQRIFDLYVWNTMNEQSPSGLVLGSDWFVAPMEPLHHLHAAVTRKSSNYPDGFNVKERLPLVDALRAYTANGAWSMFKEDSIGALKEGLLGDITILDRDILDDNFNVDDLLETKVLSTIVGGKVMYHNNDDVGPMMEGSNR